MESVIKWAVNISLGGCGLDLFGSEQGSVACFCEYSNESCFCKR
jgi:hypothetical protein